MSIRNHHGNRAEWVPFLLAAADFLIFGCLTAVFLPHRTLAVFFPFLVFLVLYACGEYSLFLEFEPRRLGVSFACILFLAVTAVAIAVTGMDGIGSAAAAARLGAAALGCIGWVLAHGGIARSLLSRSCRYTFHMSPDMRLAGDAIGRHLGRSRYPARVFYDREPGIPADRVPVDVVNPRRNAGDPRCCRTLDVDPAAFCERTLHVLPPAALIGSTAAQWDGKPRRAYEGLQRLFDVCGSAFLLAAASPLLAFAAIGILAADGRPVLFRQIRVGRRGKRFLLYKFRSLRSVPPSEGTPNDGIEKRAFPFGAFLRGSRLDELPQLANVLRGDMSLIGPRPEMEFFHERAEGTIPFYAQRLTVRPGITGWAQVRFPHTTEETDYWDKTAYDLWYVRHRGPLTDLRIVVRTVGVMLLGFGAR